MRRLRRQFFYAQITFGILTLITGVFMSFLYKWTNYNYFAGIIAPINDSTWEQLKIFFFPIIILSVFEYCFIGKYFPSFVTSRAIGCLCGLFFTVVFFYTYTGIIGSSYQWLDISTIFFSTALCYCITWHLTITKKAGGRRSNFVSVCLLLLVCYAFFRFTTKPPAINLFQSETVQLMHNPILQ